MTEEQQPSSASASRAIDARTGNIIRGARRRLKTRSFNSRVVARATLRTHALCVGDSHSEVFRYIEQRRLVPRARFDVYSVGGATAQGAVNPNSKTDALRLFSARLEKARPWQRLLFQLGEVDCGFVIWYRAKKYNQSVELQLENSLGRYLEFLVLVRTRGFLQMTVLSAPLPTIGDGQTWGKVADARKEITVPQRERTQLTLVYNERLRMACLESGFGFLDVTTGQLDPETGVIKPAFLNPDPLDHHLDSARYADLVSSRVGPFLVDKN
jgi:hypothetical protein